MTSMLDVISDLVQEAPSIALPDDVLDMYKAVAKDVNMRLNYYKFLRILTQDFIPDFIIELGVEYGVASAMMASVGTCPVIGVDINKHGNISIIEERFKNYVFFQRDTTDPQTYLDVRDMIVHAAKLQHGIGKGLIFQDSSHHYAASNTEWNKYSSLCTTGSIWVCDDISPAFHDPLIDPPGKGMVQYFQELPGQKKLFTDVLHIGNTMGVVLL